MSLSKFISLFRTRRLDIKGKFHHAEVYITFSTLKKMSTGSNWTYDLIPLCARPLSVGTDSLDPTLSGLKVNVIFNA